MTEKKPVIKKAVEQRKEQAVALLNARKEFLTSNKLQDFDQWEEHQKLAVSQKIEDKFIRRRKIGQMQVPYLPHTITEKILNFVFNFRVSNEVLEIGSETVVTPQGKKFYDAYALVKFTLVRKDGTEIVRTVLGTHKGYDNPATSQHDAKKSAISKSWTVVARTFGIGTDLEKKEREAYEQAEQSYTPPPEKDMPGGGNIPF